jgi:diguanylate cyclase (GGDEF)-like protein
MTSSSQILLYALADRFLNTIGWSLLNINQDSQQALTTAQDWLRQHPDSPEALWLQSISQFSHWHEILHDPKPKQSVVDCLQTALFQRHQLNIDYRGKTATVHPFAWSTRNGIHYLACTFWDYSNPVWLAIHRIDAAEELNQPMASKASEATRQAFIKKPPIEENQEWIEQIELEFPEHLHKSLIERPPRGENVQISDIEDGHFRVTADRILGSYGFYWWLLGFNDLVRIVNPKSLKKRIHPLLYDPLTGLLTRHEFNRTLYRQIARTLRTAEPFILIFVDLDHFGQVNKRFNQAFGDKVLKHAVSKLQQGRRGTDCVSRFGGEEFMLLLPAVNCDDAANLGESVRQTLEQNPLALTDEETTIAKELLANNTQCNLRLQHQSQTGITLTITASVGVVCCQMPKDATTDTYTHHSRRSPKEWRSILMKQTANALQKAKKSRNCVITHHFCLTDAEEITCDNCS